MKRFVPALWTAVAGAGVMVFASPWLFAGVGLFLPVFVLVGLVMAVAVKEISVYKYLDRLLVGSLAFGILAVVLVAARMSLELFFRDKFPTVFASVWNSGLFIMAAAVAAFCFFGGLVGVALKGFYALYGKKLDAIILFGGPLVAMAASLFVFTARAGGTILSAYHGWPYPFLIHQLRDVLDGFAIDAWIFSPGSLYHYVIFNYLFYFSALLVLFYAIAFLNEKLALKMSRTIAVCAVWGLSVWVLVSYLPGKQSYISHQIAKAGYCTADTDCTIVANRAPFSCAIVANIAEAGRIRDLVYSYPSTGGLQCSGEERAICMDHRCEIGHDYAPLSPSGESLRVQLAACLPKSDTASHERCQELLQGINGFEGCVDAGFSVMKSNPPQCALPDGRTFVEGGEN